MLNLWRSKLVLLRHLLLAVFVLVICVSNLPNNFTGTCSSDKTFVKEWSGAVGTVVGNVIIENKDTGQVYWNAPIPANNKITISNLPHGCFLRIKWTDWNGAHQEIVEVQCVDDTEYKLNYIPPPPSKLEQYHKTMERVEAKLTRSEK